MIEPIFLSITFSDPELLEATAQEYDRAIEAEEMTLEEAQDNFEALALGMMEIG